MARHILFCKVCNEYTMSEACPRCGKKAVTSRPPKFSPDDKYAELKRRAKESGYRARGLI